MELLSPAGSMEALIAAVQAGADAVYLGAGDFNARQSAQNFTMEQLEEATTYAHLRGVQVYLTLNTLVTDRQISQVETVVKEASLAGVDGFIVQDWGVLRLCQEVAPHVPCHGSTQMAVHSLEGVKMAAKLGCTRVVVARELSRQDLMEICQNSPIEIEAFGHGALCMCHSGQCYYSAVIGRRSGNRGQCAQPCRLPMGYDTFENRYPLSLKDSCLVDYALELEQMGVASLKLEGRMKRPEYVAIVTATYRKALDGETLTRQDYDRLTRIFSRDGFTDGYFLGKLGKEMFGTRQDQGKIDDLLKEARSLYETDGKRAEIQLDYTIDQENPMVLQATCGKKSVTVTGDMAQEARTRSMTAEQVEKQLSKTGGTPFVVNHCEGRLGENLMVPASSLNGLRRLALEALEQTMLGEKITDFGTVSTVKTQNIPQNTPEITIYIETMKQATATLLQKRPTLLYMPLQVLAVENLEILQGQTLCAVLPRVMTTAQRETVKNQLKAIKAKGISHVLGGNLGHLELAEGFTLHGDYGLNLYNSLSTDQVASWGLTSMTASFELLLPQIRDLHKPIPMELMVYGRLPLMVTENCLIRQKNGNCSCKTPTSLVDKTGAKFPLLPHFGCRTQVMNSKILNILDKDLADLNIWAYRLSFTTESPEDVDKILKNPTFNPETQTRGLYFRGVT